MKILITFLILFSTTVFGATKLETHCKGNDCFTNGWITTGPDYTLDTQCNKNDCRKFGWYSVANDDSTFNVSCREGGCFKGGWYSTQEVSGLEYNDIVTCINGDCLANGWNVMTGYDMMGGSVRCFGNDCSKYGGTSYWRGRPSYTVCYEADCYHKGWDWYVY